MNKAEHLARVERDTMHFLELCSLHNVRATHCYETGFFEGINSLRFVEPKELSENETKQAVVATHDCIYAALYARKSRKAYALYVQRIRSNFDALLVRRQSAIDLYAFYTGARMRSKRMELLTEAFRRGYDNAPIFTAIAKAETLDELELLEKQLTGAMLTNTLLDA